MIIYAPRINGITNPLGHLLVSPTVSWKVCDAAGSRQVWAQVQISDSESFSNILWQVQGEDLDSLGAEITMELTARTRYYVRIAVTSDIGETAVSEIFWFETGKLDEPWMANWIGIEEENIYPEFVKEFTVKKAVTRARLYICGLGLFEAYLNGQKAGEDHLAPFNNDYQEHFQYCTYDVTNSLQENNQLTVLLGKGWYMGRYGLVGKANTDRRFALIAELYICYDDGTEDVIVTDKSWRYRESPWELTDIYDGEIQNWQKPIKGLERPAIPVIVPGKLIERYSPPLTEQDILPVREVIHTPAGETVLDFGQNFAGFVRCTQFVPAGVTMTLEFGEVLQNGSFYHDNYRSAKSRFVYRSGGASTATEAHFTFFGFRYVKVTGLDTVDSTRFFGVVLHSQMDRTGWLTTSNEKINRLHENALWSLKSNSIDTPTDCPQRDERLAWSGDVQVFAPTAGYLMDMRAFYRKFLLDLRSDQKRNDGKVAVFLPNEFPGLFASAWSDIAAFLPNMLYRYYGSKTVLAEHFPMMRDWVDAVRKMDRKRGEKHLWDFGFQFGDWLALDGATEQSMIGRTDSGFVSSCYYYASTMCVAQAARVLGYSEAEDYAQLAVEIRQAILREYFTETGRLAIDTQTGYLLALRFGIYKDRKRIVDGLLERIHRDCRRIKGGFLGATAMNTVLGDQGLTELAYDFLLFEGFPGWLYAVNLGATTIWERWNSLLPDGTVSGTGMNSFNHYAYGSVVEFLYRHSAGIQPMAAGFRRIRLAPKPDYRLRTLECRYDSASGLYVSRWDIQDDGALHFQFEIPFGCEAVISLPEQEEFTVSSGRYDFTVRTQKDYRHIYTADTPIESLINDARAAAIIEKYLPGFIGGLNRNDIEAMNESLAGARRQAFFFRRPKEPFDRIIQEISELM